jgi:hypothetical protein
VPIANLIASTVSRPPAERCPNVDRGELTIDATQPTYLRVEPWNYYTMLESSLMRCLAFDPTPHPRSRCPLEWLAAILQPWKGKAGGVLLEEAQGPWVRSKSLVNSTSISFPASIGPCYIGRCREIKDANPCANDLALCFAPNPMPAHLH